MPQVGRPPQVVYITFVLLHQILKEGQTFKSAWKLECILGSVDWQIFSSQLAALLERAFVQGLYKRSICILILRMSLTILGTGYLIGGGVKVHAMLTRLLFLPCFYAFYIMINITYVPRTEECDEITSWYWKETPLLYIWLPHWRVIVVSLSTYCFLYCYERTKKRSRIA